MRTRSALAAIVAGGVIALGVLVAVPALAAGGSPTGGGPGGGPGPGAPMATIGNQGGCRPDGVVATGTLTEQQRATLAFNAEEEKLAHDLYAAFADRYGATVFDRIAAAETHHLAAVRTMMTRYDVTDPTAGLAPGSFATPAVQTAYDDLLARGVASEQEALEVGRTVETDDIDQLRTALDGLTAPDVQRVYTHLLRASERHYDAFTAWLAR
jgi:hypothetical protein